MTKLRPIAGAAIVLACAVPMGADTALAQTPQPGSPLSADALRAVEQASVVRIRTERFSGRLERPRLDPAGILIQGGCVSFTVRIQVRQLHRAIQEHQAVYG